MRITAIVATRRVWGHVAAHDAGEIVPALLEPMVGDTVLQDIVGADFLRAVGGADLLGALARHIWHSPSPPASARAWPEDGHRALAVGVLRALDLAARVDAGRHVDDAHGRLDLVDVLAAGAAGARISTSMSAGFISNCVLLADRQDGDRRGRGVDAARLLGRGNALDAMHAGLKAQAFVDTLAAHFNNDFFIAAEIGLGLRKYARAPSLRLGICAYM